MTVELNLFWTCGLSVALTIISILFFSLVRYKKYEWVRDDELDMSRVGKELAVHGMSKEEQADMMRIISLLEQMKCGDEEKEMQALLKLEQYKEHPFLKKGFVK